ncbi:MAG: hypothetical protein QM743_00465 [Chitinophagaceae bacterium]
MINITLTVLSVDDGSELLTLKNQLLQICSNLISNAIKFTPQGRSRIRVAAYGAGRTGK